MYDAVLCGRDFPNEGVGIPSLTPGPTSGGIDRDVARNALFGPLLGTHRVMSREVPSLNASFVTRWDDPTTLAFPTSHPRHPEYQHVWHVAVVENGEVLVGAEVTQDAASRGGLFVGVKKS